jgi:hypothetical protein
MGVSVMSEEGVLTRSHKTYLQAIPSFPFQPPPGTPCSYSHQTMGGAASRFDETDWDKADGGLREASETFDGKKPSSRHTILTLKKPTIVNQREFEIRDDLNTLLYTSSAVSGTTKWFDFFADDGKKLFRIQADSSRSTWDVYSCSPSFENQKPDGQASDKAGERLYRKARIDITWNKNHGDVYPIVPSADDLEGVAQEDSILKVEVIKSVTAQYQAFKSDNMIDFPHPPLTSWWVWEHLPHSHQMRMRLAKGSDIALHSIMAIATNLVYIEKATNLVE